MTEPQKHFPKVSGCHKFPTRIVVGTYNGKPDEWHECTKCNQPCRVVSDEGLDQKIASFEEEKCKVWGKPCEGDIYGHCYYCGRNMLQSDLTSAMETKGGAFCYLCNELKPEHYVLFDGRFLCRQCLEKSTDFYSTIPTLDQAKKWLKHFDHDVKKAETLLDKSNISFGAIKHLIEATKVITRHDQKEEQKEIIICAAVKTTTGKIYRGHRHGDCMAAIRSRHYISSEKAEDQGFITSKGRYVTREEGRELQDAAGIKSVAPDGYCGKTLYSEDLY